MKLRNLIAAITFGILLIWGPINHTMSGWLFIRIAYLIIIPIFVWWLFKWIWNYWQPTKEQEALAEKIAAGIICLGLWTLAVLEATSKTHIGNTRWVQTHEGMEAVGDDILLQGPDWSNVLLLVAISLGILWYGVIMKPTTKD